MSSSHSTLRVFRNCVLHSDPREVIVVTHRNREYHRLKHSPVEPEQKDRDLLVQEQGVLDDVEIMPVHHRQRVPAAQDRLPLRMDVDRPWMRSEELSCKRSGSLQTEEQNSVTLR